MYQTSTPHRTQAHILAEAKARRDRVQNQPIPMDELFYALFGITLTELRQKSERGELTRVSSQMAKILGLASPRSVNHWHEGEEDDKIYFSRIPPDRLVALRYYYHATMPHNNLHRF